MSNFTLPTQRAKRLADKFSHDFSFGIIDLHDLILLEANKEFNGMIREVISELEQRKESYERTGQKSAVLAIVELMDFFQCQLGTIEHKPSKRKKG